MSTAKSSLPILVAGGGIGGLAAALALARHGFAVKVLEQASEIGEIGAGIQLGPNAFSAFDALGIGERARGRAVYTERLLLMDAVDESEVASVPVGEAFRARFGNPYAVSAFDADGKVGIDYGVYGVPETFVIDKQGVIRYKQIGPITPEALERTILPLVRQLNG